MTCSELVSIQRGFDLLAFGGLCIFVGICLAKLRSMRRRVWAIGQQTMIHERKIKDLEALLQGEQYAARH